MSLWEAVLECYIWLDHFLHSCQKSKAQIGKFPSERKSYTLWSLFSSSWCAVSFLCMASIQQLVQTLFTGCVLFWLPTVGLWWSWVSLPLWLLDLSCSYWLGQRLSKWTTMFVRIVHYCEFDNSSNLLFHISWYI